MLVHLLTHTAVQAEGRLSCLQGALHLVTKLQARHAPAATAHLCLHISSDPAWHVHELTCHVAVQAEGRLSCLQGALHLVTKLQARHAPAATAHLEACRAGAGLDMGSSEDDVTALEQALQVRCSQACIDIHARSQPCWGWLGHRSSEDSEQASWLAQSGSLSRGMRLLLLCTVRPAKQEPRLDTGSSEDNVTALEQALQVSFPLSDGLVFSRPPSAQWQ